MDRIVQGKIAMCMSNVCDTETETEYTPDQGCSKAGYIHTYIHTYIYFI